MNLKLLLDEDVQYMLSEALQKRGYDVVHVQECDRKGMTDQEQLEFATQNKRCLFKEVNKEVPHTFWGKGPILGR